MSILDGGDNDPNAVYVQPNIEIKLSAEKRRECRDIVREIVNFGVNDRQKLFIIQLLALEIENREVMQRIIKSVQDSREEVPVGNKIELPKEGDM